MRNEYDGLVEPWKAELIQGRAKVRKLNAEDIDELQQEIVPQLQRFHYDPDHHAGASERTVLTSLIDKRISAFLRARRRNREAMERHRRHVLDTRGTQGAAEDSKVLQTCELRIDIQEVLAHLSKIEVDVCLALARGTSRFQIAKDLGLPRYEINKIIERIRETFIQCGFEG